MVFYLTLSIVGIVSERRSVQLATALAAFSVQLVFVFRDLGVLGAW